MKCITLLFALCAIVGFSAGSYSSSSSNINLVPESHDNTCHSDHECPNNLSCIDYKCKCPEHTVRQGEKCYGMIGAYCSDSCDCLSTRLMCVEGKCVTSTELKEGHNECTEKAGATVCWGPHKVIGAPNVVCRVYSEGRHFSVPGVVVTMHNGDEKCMYIWNGHEMYFSEFDYLQGNEHIYWKKSGFTLDKAVYGGKSEHEQLTLQCQAEHCGKIFYGRLSPPDFDICHFVANGTIQESHEYDTLVYADY